MSKKIELRGPYEDVISLDNHFYIIHKLNKICVLPYTISAKGLLDKIGVIKTLDNLTEKEMFKLIDGTINQDDQTNLVCANRILYEIIGSNVTKANNWMYLGKLDNLTDSGIIIYCVDITDVDINDSKDVEEIKKAMKFQMLDANKVVSSDDALFLAAYMRLFNFFFVSSLKK